MGKIEELQRKNFIKPAHFWFTTLVIVNTRRVISIKTKILSLETSTARRMAASKKKLEL